MLFSNANACGKAPSSVRGPAVLLSLIATISVASSAQAQPFAYVVGQKDPVGTAAVVSVIDISTNLRVTSIPVGANCLCVNPDGIAIAPDVARVYVTNELANSVSVIDVGSNTVVATIPVGTGPTAIVASPNGTRVYVLNGSGVTSVSAIDTATNAVLTTTPLAVGQARGMALTPDGARLYVSTYGSNSVKVIATASMTVTATIPVGNLPVGVDISPDGSRAYVAALLSNAVSVINTTTNAVVATIQVGTGPGSARVTPDGSRAYVANSTSSSVSVINTQSNIVVATVPVTFNPRTVDLSPDGTRAYVANDLNVQVINTATNTVTATIPFIEATHGHPGAIVIGRAAAGSTPTTVNDSYGTNINTVLSVPGPGVLANDNTNGGGTLTTLLVSDVANGTLALNADGDFVYNPTTGFSGIDSFTYRAVNTVGSGNIATVTLTVATGLPTAVNDAYTTSANIALNVAAPGVLANDNSDGGGAMTTVLVTNVVNGTLALAANGGFTYTPLGGFAGADTFTYRAVNTVGSSNAATVTLTVNPGSPTAQSPTGLYASAIAGNTVTLRWTPPAGGLTPTGYALEGGVTPGQVLASLATGSASPIFTFTAPTGAFYVRIHTLSGANKSAASNEIRLFVNVPAAPSAPTNLLGLVNGSNLSLAWRNTFEGGAPTSLLLDVSGTLSATLPLPLATTFSFAGVPPGTYTLSLRAANPAGTSGPSNPVTLTFPGACSGVPLTPANFLASKKGNVITVVWDPAAGGPAPTAFVLNVSGAFVGSFPTTLRSLSGTVGAGSYTLSVYATNACGTSAPTVAQTVVIP